MTLLSVIVPTISGREESLAQVLDAYHTTLQETPYEIIPIKDYPTWPSACNEGYQQAQGDVLFFGADDLDPMPGWHYPALLHLSVHNELPAPFVYDKQTLDGSTRWANAEDGGHGNIPLFTRVPIMTRAQYEQIGPWPHIDYYADYWVSEKARTLGIETRMVEGYNFFHRWSQIGRVDTPENMDRAGAEFNRLVKEMKR